MSYTDLNPDDIEKDVIYVSMKEILKELDVSRTTINNHINTNKVNALRFRNRTYFHPDEADRYRALFKAGLLG